MAADLKFTLVTTTFNEIRRIEDTIADIENQVLKPSELVITDAGSTDGTYEKLLAWSAISSTPIKVLSKPKCNVAEGRNLAINAASFPIIASTDFGCRFHRDWLKSIIAPFEDPNVKVVGGGYTVIEEDIRSLAAKANYILSAGYTSVMNEYFIPSSRSIAYYKNVWEHVGGYAEWLTLAADDLVFGKVLKSMGYKFHLVDKSYVFWGRHIEAKSYGKEAFRYGLGDGEAQVNQRQFVKATIESVCRYIFLFWAVAGSLLVACGKLSLTYLIFLLPFGIGFRPYIHAFRNWNCFKSDKYSLKVLLFSLYLVEISRVNYIKGYLKGFFFSSKNVKSQAKKLKSILRG